MAFSFADCVLFKLLYGSQIEQCILVLLQVRNPHDPVILLPDMDLLIYFFFSTDRSKNPHLVRRHL